MYVRLILHIENLRGPQKSLTRSLITARNLVSFGLHDCRGGIHSAPVWISSICAFQQLDPSSIWAAGAVSDGLWMPFGRLHDYLHPSPISCSDHLVDGDWIWKRSYGWSLERMDWEYDQCH
jgi:hypothetical protein